MRFSSGSFTVSRALVAQPNIRGAWARSKSGSSRKRYPVRRNVLARHRFQPQLYLGPFFILFLSPLPPGGPGEGPDCECPKGIMGLGPRPDRIRAGGGPTFYFYSGPKRSWAWWLILDFSFGGGTEMVTKWH